jgi:indole-3-glycerol phosphate synthase
MMFLERILAKQKEALARKKSAAPVAKLFAALDAAAPQLRPFGANLRASSIQIIAEIKKASPSKGLLCPNFNPEALARAYEAAGVAAISVLTEEEFFLGSLADLKEVKASTDKIPALRKDFLIDPYQLLEARLYGADAVLLIVAALDRIRLRQLLGATEELGMTALVETHDRDEAGIALDAGATVIGINNRNLRTFAVNLETTYQVLAKLPDAVIKVSESGITARADLAALEAAGVDAVLIGETLVTAVDPGAKIRELLGGGA